MHEFVDAWLQQVEHWPMIGSPDWCALDDDDPSKWAALLSAAEHWALRIEGNQQAIADAGSAISGAVPWSEIARKRQARNEFYEQRPWAKRVTS